VYQVQGEWPSVRQLSAGLGGGNGQSDGYLERTQGYEFKPWPERPRRVQALQRNAEEEYENDRF
jgi:hypothetical protein